MPRQSNLCFTFSVGEGIEFDVIEFTLEEALSETFRLEVQLSSADPAVDFGEVLDRPALLTIWQNGQPVRYVHGVVSALEQGDTGFRRTCYRAVVEPELARLKLCSDWRIFQTLSVPEILQRVLKQHGITQYEQLLTGEHLPREYCVQAGDTDFDFLERIAREEGFYFTFKHTARDHQLVHSDKLFIQGHIGEQPVRYNATPGGDQPEPALRRFRYVENVRTVRQTQRDYLFTHPRYDQQHSKWGEDVGRQSGSDYERYNYPGRYKRDEAGRPFTLNRLRGHRRDARVAIVEGDDPRLVPGICFDLVGHPREAWNSGWRPVRMRHHGVQHTSQAEESVGAELGVHYSYVAELVTDHTEWRAEPLPKPRIDGAQPALVVGPAGEEIHCDQWGRVKIQFPWDRQGAFNEHSSCWVRTTQNWAGAAWGHMAIPRIGQEVLVIFVNSDPDQPIIVGRTYMATQLPPYELPRHKTRMTIKSKSHKGEGFNEIRFEDENDQEEIYVHAQKDQNIRVNHNETTFVGHDRSEQVEHDETIAIGHDRKETVVNDEQVSIGHDRRHLVGQDDFLNIGSNHTINTGKDRTEEVGNTRRDKTAVDHFIEIGGHREAVVNGHAHLQAGQDIVHRTKKYRIQVEEEFVLEGPGGTLTINGEGIFLSGFALDFKGPMKVASNGSGNGHGVAGSPLAGLFMDRPCAMRADGSCPRKPCPCGKGEA